MGLMPVVIGQERDFGEFKWQSRVISNIRFPAAVRRTVAHDDSDQHLQRRYSRAPLANAGRNRRHRSIAALRQRRVFLHHALEPLAGVVVPR